jgi:hypothetical protein
MLDASVLKDYAKIGSLAAVATSGAFTDLKGLPVLIAADQKCAAGTLVAGLGADGKVVCVTAPTYGGKDFALAGQACGAGLNLTGIDGEGKPVCALPVQAGLACQLGQVVTGFDAAGKPVCGAGVQAGQSCAAGQVVTGFNAAGAPVCAADKVNVYGGKDFALANQACPAGQVVTGVDANGKPVCAAGGTMTAVTASAPLASSGGATPNLTLAQATASVNGFLAAGDWTSFASKVASVAATSGGGLLAGGTASAPTLGLTNACGAGQILKWSGSAWACAADNDTNSGGTVTSVGGSAPIVSSGGATPVLLIARASASASGYLAAGDWTSFASKVASIAATTGGGLLAGGTVTSVGVTAGGGLVAAGTATAPTVGLTTSCAVGQMLKWNGSAWGCGADNDTNSGGTVTSVTATGPLASSGGATPNLTLVQASASAAGFVAAADWNAFNSKLASLAATAGGGLAIGGSATAPTVGLTTSCAGGQILKWNGSAWACAADVDTSKANVVSTEFTNVAKLTSTTFVDVPGFSATITPSSASSRVLVMANVVAGMNSATTGGYRIVRGATPIAVPPDVGGYVSVSSASFYGGSGDSNNNEEASVTFLDSPGSAGAVTYKIQVYAPQGTTIVVNGLGSDTAGLNWSQRARSSLTLMEMR